MIEITVTTTAQKPVRYLKVDAGVRYWEDASVDGEKEDNDSPKMPFADGGRWRPMIDLESGIIEEWPSGVVASVHYKVCDEGIYTLLSADMAEVTSIDGYVPDILSPGDNGYGDYIIMDIDGDGRIANWRVDLSDFEARS